MAKQKQVTWRDSFSWGGGKKELDSSNATHVSFFSQKLSKGKGKFSEGFAEIKNIQKPSLSKEVLAELTRIVSKKNISTSDFDRVKYSHGKYYSELIEQRLGKIENVCDAVLFPKTEREIFKILKYCEKKKIPVSTYGAGSSVTLALRTPKKGIVIDMSRHFNKIVNLNQENFSVVTQPGVYGPVLEEYLNKNDFTCGHFPQSFEFSTVGGWVSARGAGQASTGYGRVEDMVLGLRVVTPMGIHVFSEIPASAVGIDLKRLFIGSEGSLGLITEITMKVRRYKPQNTRYVSFLFKDFKSSVNAMREIMQMGISFPHVFRISDGEETQVSFELKEKDKGIIGATLKTLGYYPGKRSFMYATIEGEKKTAKLTAKIMKSVAKKHGALSLGKYPIKKWLEQRYSSAYVRDPLMDAGVRIDTLETSVRWDNLFSVWEKARSYIKSFPETYCLAHISHVYENGANLYFVFSSPMAKEPHKNELKDFSKFHKGLVNTIVAAGGTLSHHHGVGRLTADKMESVVGKESFKLLQGIKSVVDKERILNPGVLGL